ncbi:MAG: hypothetical protein KatS3mg051_1625 [Anaerolineae bacterium]|nr:MAG: hypothetical protein KatS3mg051_1625 [Anaerolineae bacterium]
MDKYSLLQTQRLSVKPGITGLWQIYDRGDTDFDKRLIWDIKYIEKMSLTLDLSYPGAHRAEVHAGRALNPVSNWTAAAPPPPYSAVPVLSRRVTGARYCSP